MYVLDFGFGKTLQLIQEIVFRNFQKKIYNRYDIIVGILKIGLARITAPFFNRILEWKQREMEIQNIGAFYDIEYSKFMRICKCLE